MGLSWHPLPLGLGIERAVTTFEPESGGKQRYGCWVPHSSNSFSGISLYSITLLFGHVRHSALVLSQDFQSSLTLLSLIHLLGITLNTPTNLPSHAYRSLCHTDEAITQNKQNYIMAE
jgi:hypothetical protein